VNAPKLRDRIADEIGRIPDSNLVEVFDLLHYFRIGIETARGTNGSAIMQFAGAWQDMNPQDVDELQQEIGARRKAAFGQRRSLDGNPD